MSLRVHQLADLIASGVVDRKLTLYASETYNVGERQATELIAKARELINNDYACERPEFVASRLSILDDNLKKAAAEKRYGAVVQLIRLQCELTGILGRTALTQTAIATRSAYLQ